MDIISAKAKLDNVITISRSHLYKPIQIAEILYRDRIEGDIDTSDLSTYRNQSKKWRDDITIELVGRKCTSSARYQDNIFEENAVPPEAVTVLSEFNKRYKGIVEAYIYSRFSEKYGQLNNALDICKKAEKETFQLSEFINSFSTESGLKRSLDKIYEVIVYSLFSVIIDYSDAEITVSIPNEKASIFKEFSRLTEALMMINIENMSSTTEAKIYRVGVTNAADRGVDMYANWGPLVQVKHLTLDVELAKNIVEGVTSDKIIIVCKYAEKSIIESIITQVGWRNRVQSIITEKELIDWYEKALRGDFSEDIGQELLDRLVEEVLLEFPSTGGFPDILNDRKYEEIDLELFSKIK